MTATRQVKNGPLAKRSPTAKKLNIGEGFGGGERRIARNIKRFADGRKAFFCAKIRKETGNEQSARRCAIICHEVALDRGHPTIAKGVEREFGLSEQGSRRRVDKAIETHISNWELDCAYNVASEYGPEEKVKEINIKRLAVELYKGNEEVAYYREKHGLSEGDVYQARIYAASWLLADYAKAKANIALGICRDDVPIDYKAKKDRAIYFLSNDPEELKAAAIAASTMILIETELPERGSLTAQALLKELGVFPPKPVRREEDVPFRLAYHEAIDKLWEKEEYTKALILSRVVGLGEPSEELLDLALTEEIGKGMHTDVREVAKEKGRKELGKLNDVVEKAFWKLTQKKD
ncbi:MAG: hypothetical protein GY852_05205 [bacterium]|nr:hypothetical protein [bacterium]